MAKPLVPKRPERPTRCKYWGKREREEKEEIDVSWEEHTNRHASVFVCVCVCIVFVSDRVWVGWHIVVEYDVDTLEVDTAAEDISRHKDTRAVLLELVVSIETLILRQATIDRHRRKVVLDEELVQLLATTNT